MNLPLFICKDHVILKDGSMMIFLQCRFQLCFHGYLFECRAFYSLQASMGLPWPLKSRAAGDFVCGWAKCRRFPHAAPRCCPTWRRGTMSWSGSWANSTRTTWRLPSRDYSGMQTSLSPWTTSFLMWFVKAKSFFSLSVMYRPQVSPLREDDCLHWLSHSPSPYVRCKWLSSWMARL